MRKDKKSLKLLAALISTLAVNAVFADDNSAPNLADYYAMPAPQPSFSQRVQNEFTLPQGVYLGAKLSFARIQFSNIQRLGPIFSGQNNPVPAHTQVNKSQAIPGFVIGYAFSSLRWPSRFEVEYGYYGKIKYNADPVLLNATEQVLNSSITNHVVQFNFYHDFSGLWDRFIPYVGAGIGPAFNRVSSTATIINDPIIGTQTITNSQNKTNMAWNIRAGARIRLSPQFTADAGYQYIQFGKTAPWQLAGQNQLQIQKMSANTLMLGLTWQFK